MPKESKSKSPRRSRSPDQSERKSRDPDKSKPCKKKQKRPKSCDKSPYKTELDQKRAQSAPSSGRYGNEKSKSRTYKNKNSEKSPESKDSPRANSPVHTEPHLAKRSKYPKNDIVRRYRKMR